MSPNKRCMSGPNPTSINLQDVNPDKRFILDAYRFDILKRVVLDLNVSSSRGKYIGPSSSKNPPIFRILLSFAKIVSFLTECLFPAFTEQETLKVNISFKVSTFEFGLFVLWILPLEAALSLVMIT